MNRIIDIYKTGIVLFFLILSTTVDAQEISEPLESFSRLKSSNSVKVALIPSDEYRIEVDGYDKDEVHYEVKGNLLEIRLSWDNVFSDSNTIVTVFFKDLEEIDANSRSVVSLEKAYETDNMVFSAGEGASITASISVDRATLKATTGGHIRLIGEADSQDVRVNTGGLYSGRDFKTKDSEVQIATGGQADVYSSESCRVNAKLGGNVNVFGNPKRVDQKSSLGGNISISN